MVMKFVKSVQMVKLEGFMEKVSFEPGVEEKKVVV